MFENRLTIVIQKPSGRLGQESRQILVDSGFNFPVTERVDYSRVSDFPLDAVFLRASDIPTVVGAGKADFGIVGLDGLIESRSCALNLLPLNFGLCTVKLGTRKDVPFNTVTDLSGKTIATTYTNITSDFFGRWGVNYNLLPLEGSVEVALKKGWAEACIDASSTGVSMELNGIIPRLDLFESQAVLISSPQLGGKTGSERIVEQLLSRLLSTLRTRQSTWLVMNVPTKARAEVEDVLPSKESPTVTPLEEEGWSSLASVVPREGLNDLIVRLLEAGATDIIEQQIRNVIPNRGDGVMIEMMKKIYR